MDKELVDFLEFEKREKLFARTYKGVSYWQSVRYDIQRAISFKSMEKVESSSQKSRGIWKEIGSLLKQGIEDIRDMVALKPGDLLYFDEQLYRYADGKMVDSYFDYWRFEERYSVRRCYHHAKEDRKPQCTGIGVSVATLIQGGLYRLSKIAPNIFADAQEDKFIVDLCYKINAKFGADIRANRMIQNVRDVVLHYNIYGRYYGWLIRKVKPRAIFVVCYFDSKLFPLYEIAHKYHVPVIELEHGLICNHGAYNYKDLTKKGKQLPDFFFTYGDFWNQYIQLPRCMQPIAVGNPFLERQRRKYSNITPDERTIVFYSDEIGVEQAQFVIDFYKRNAKNGYHVCFKPHPREYPNFQELYSIFEAYPEIRIIPKEMSLYELLAGAKHHVSAVSTVLFEAAIFDVKRYVMYLPEWIQYIQPLVDVGLAKMFHDLDELQELLDEEESQDKSILDYIWKRNARQNALEALERIIGD